MSPSDNCREIKGEVQGLELKRDVEAKSLELEEALHLALEEEC